MRSARDQSPSLPIDVLGISLQRVPHVVAWRVGCHLSSPPRHSTGVRMTRQFHQLNRTLTCMVLKAKANDRRTPSPLPR
ncbi:hypothetical protein TNCV_3813031 [Trichonephila clavipes]|nr:hypothetical protein TNCV_3813031 [Trichonephila clavipes]